MTAGTTTYIEQVAKVRNVQLGWEDHGIFTCMIDLDYGDSSQSVGGYALDSKPTGDQRRRVGTAYGMEWIISLMRAVGAADFSEIKGKTIIALRDGDGWGAKVVGIKPLPFEEGEPFIFEQLAFAG